MNNSATLEYKPQRLASLDVMRGLIMILLAAESCRVYLSLNDFQLGTAGKTIMQQFFHHPWNGLHFWDLIQPAFMLMAGSAMYISYYYKTKKGISWSQNFRHIFVRCVKLFFLGVIIHCVHAGALVWELWNILTQLAVTTIIAYLIIRKSYTFQFIVSILILVLTEVLYRSFSLPGYDQPFVMGQNFGSWMDMVLMGKINGDGWVAINIIPTAAHTIWGAMAGKLLIENRPELSKIKWLLIAGFAGLIIGYGLDIANITPIIKRISTSSFVLASGGWVLLILALLYWITDMLKYNKYAWICIVVGMNSIFIYMFFQILGGWLVKTTGIFTNGFMSMIHVPEKIMFFITSLVALYINWYLCYWLYKKKIFIKL